MDQRRNSGKSRLNDEHRPDSIKPTDETVEVNPGSERTVPEYMVHVESKNGVMSDQCTPRKFAISNSCLIY